VTNERATKQKPYSKEIIQQILTNFILEEKLANLNKFHFGHERAEQLCTVRMYMYFPVFVSLYDVISLSICATSEQRLEQRTFCMSTSAPCSASSRPISTLCWRAATCSAVSPWSYKR